MYTGIRSTGTCVATPESDNRLSDSLGLLYYCTAVSRYFVPSLLQVTYRNKHNLSTVVKLALLGAFILGTKSPSHHRTCFTDPWVHSSHSFCDVRPCFEDDGVLYVCFLPPLSPSFIIIIFRSFTGFFFISCTAYDIICGTVRIFASSLRSRHHR